MRSYGIVRSKFWAWAKEREISQNARELALYCLTCEHTNGTGCFRLPIAYIAEDLGTVPATVRKTVSELAAIGFMHHDDATGWMWLPGFLDHNPIANSNVGKSLLPFVEAVPRKLPFYSAFLDALSLANVSSEDGTPRLPEGLIDRLRNGMPNGSANGMPTHDHEHDHEHEHQHEHKHDHDAGAGADDAREVFNAYNAAAERIGGRWPRAKDLTSKRRKQIRARIKAVGKDAVVDVIAKAEASKFVREQWTSFGLDKLLLEDNFNKIRDGNYDNNRQPQAPAGRVDAVVEVAEMYRRQAGLIGVQA